MGHTLKSTLMKAAGLVLLIAGILLLPLPLPLGLPILAVALILLLSSSVTARRIVRWTRERSDRMDRFFGFFETRMAGRAGEILKSTRRRRMARRRLRTRSSP